MLLYQIALTLIPNIGPKLGKELVAYCGGVEAVFKEKTSHLIKIPGIGKETANSITRQQVMHRAEQELHFLEKHNIQPYFYLDAGYPQRLKHCVDAPLMLYFRGNSLLNHKKVVAIVGTRQASEYGKEICGQLIKDLAQHDDLMILSGLAYGIDSCAHRVALENNVPTIAVVAHGLDRIYPAQNYGLAKKMVDQGGVLTEFVSGTIPDRENFPKRNRIVAGMSDAVVVIESGEKGGALITADIANSYNRDVFAVPGRLHDKTSKGCNNLIKTNRAALLESAKDIEYIMRWDAKSELKTIQRKLFIEFTAEEQKIVDVLQQKDALPVDELILATQLHGSMLASALLNLEFEGVVKCLPGKVYTLVN